MRPAEVEQFSTRAWGELMAYERITGFAEERADWRTCALIASLANLHRDPSKQREQYVPQDFLYLMRRPTPPAPPAPMTPEELTEQIKAGFRRFKKA